jgi:multidrug efflux pump subunit AcrA (membrane-fusion protein)
MSCERKSQSRVKQFRARTLQYPDKSFKATVATTAQAINLRARTLLVELHADNPDGLLQPGAYAQVVFRLPTNPDERAAVPGARTAGRHAWSRETGSS